MKRRKRFLAVLLAVMLTLSLPGVALAKTYTPSNTSYQEMQQIIDSHWSGEAIRWLQKRPGDGIVKGGYHYFPTSSVNRAYLIERLFYQECCEQSDRSTWWDEAGNSYKMPKSLSYQMPETPFEDVPVENEAVYWGAYEGIIVGKSPQFYRPEATMTREEFITILYRYMKYRDKVHNGGKGTFEAPAYPVQYTDTKTVSSWADQAMRWAVSKKIISGKTPTTLNPRALMTLGEMCIMLKATLEDSWI